MLDVERPVDGVDRIVEQWARERPDLDTTAMAVFGRVYRLGRLSGDAVQREYAAYGLGRPEFDVLATLRRSGEPLSPGRLAAAMMLSSGGTISNMSTPLSDQPWVFATAISSFFDSDRVM